MKGAGRMAERKNSEARIRANNKYNEKAYDRINIAVPQRQESHNTGPRREPGTERQRLCE